jgi:predicted PurR-regulated permease PerM
MTDPAVGDRPRPLDGEPLPEPRRLDLRTFAVTGLFVIAATWAIGVAEPVLLPLVGAILLSFVFSPLVEALTRLLVPRAVSAAMVVLVLLAALAFGARQLAAPAADWIEKAPTTFRQLEDELRGLKRQVEKVSAATGEVEDLTRIGAEPPAVSVAPAEPTLGERLLAAGQELATTGSLTLVLLFFILAADDLFLRKLIELMPSLREKRMSVEAVRAIQRDISRYLGTITAINVLLGVAVGVSMQLLELPSPILWGVLATLLNFIPYLGALIGIALVAVAGIITFDGWIAQLSPALVYSALTAIEGYVLTPLALSRSLTLNPIAILIAVMFWGWLWGIPGALVGVPLLACMKIVFSRFQILVPVAEFLEGG